MSFNFRAQVGTSRFIRKTNTKKNSFIFPQFQIEQQISIVETGDEFKIDFGFSRNSDNPYSVKAEPTWS